MKGANRVLCVALAAMAVASTAQGPAVRIKIEDRIVAFDAAPMERGGTTMVPIRNMVSAMEGTMRWDFEKQTVSVWTNSRRFDIVLGSRQAIVNDRPVAMDEAAFLHRGRIFVPLRFAAEAAGYLISLENGWYVLRKTR